MNIGLQHIASAAIIVGTIGLISAFIIERRHYKIGGIFATLGAMLIVCGLGAYFGIMNAQDNVESHYAEYIELKAQVAEYDELDMLEQFNVHDRVMTYNLWYEKNKEDLNNKWTPKGTSQYAEEFDYLEIKN